MQKGFAINKNVKTKPPILKISCQENDVEKCHLI